MKTIQRLVTVALFLIPFTFAASGDSIFPPSGWPTSQYGVSTAMQAALSPDGKMILVMEGKTAAILDAATGAVIRVIYRYSADANFAFLSGAFLPDGTSVVLGCGGSSLLSDDLAITYEINTAQVIHNFNGQTSQGRFGHKMSIQALALSPDGSRMVTGSLDATAKLWDTATGALIETFSGHTGGVYGVAFSPDGTQVLTGSVDKTARLWSVASGQTVRTYAEHTNAINAVAFSPDGNYLATGSSDNTARIWDVAQTKSLHTLTGHTQAMNAVTFSPNGATVFTKSNDDTIKQWDRNSGFRLKSIPFNSLGYGSLVFFPASTQLLASAGLDGGLSIFDSVTGKVLKEYNVGSCHSAAFSPDGSLVLTGNGLTAWLWDKKTGAPLRSFSGHIDTINAVAFSRDGKKFVTGSADKTARLWSTQTTVSQAIFTGSMAGHTNMIWSVAISGDGTRVLTGGFDNVAKVWFTDTGQLNHTLAGHTGPVRAVAFSPDDSLLITGSDDGTVRIWNSLNGAWIKTLTDSNPQGDILTLAVSADGARLLAADTLRTVTEWQLDTGAQTFSKTYLSQDSQNAATAAFSPDGSRVIFSTTLKSEIFDRLTGDHLALIAGGRYHASLIAAFSPDATQVLLAGEGVPLLWDIARNGVSTWRLYH